MSHSFSKIFARIGLAITICASSAAGAQTPPAAEAALPPGVVALVNNEAISDEEFVGFLKVYVAQNYYHGADRERLESIAAQALDTLVTDKLLIQEAQRRGILGDPDEVSRRFDQIKSRYQKDEAFSDLLRRDEADIKAEILYDTKIEALRDSVRSVGALSQDEIRSFYESNAGLFTTPATTDVSLVLLKVPPHAVREEWAAALEKAEGLHARLVAGEAFDAIAKEFSEHETAAQGGRLGVVHKGQLEDNISEAVDAIKVGEVTAPIRILEGIAIFKANAREPAALQPLESVAERAESLLRRERQDAQWNDFLSTLRSGARIKKAASLVEYVRNL